MSEKKYASAFGPIQQFGDTPAVAVKELQDGTQVVEFTIRANWQGQPLVKVSVFPELQPALREAGIGKGTFVAVDGKYVANTVASGKTYHNLTAYEIGVLPKLAKAETGARQVVNAVEPAAAAEFVF